MPDIKLIDNDIKKALEGMIQFADTVDRSVLDMVDVQTLKNTLDYIIRLEAENERQIPKKVNISLKGTTGWNTKCHCPNCGTFISNGKYCSECGQALNWGDSKWLTK